MTTDVTPRPAPELPSFLASQMPWPRYLVDLPGGHTIHYVDTGGTGPAVWLQHGNPMWCFLWRKVIPALQQAGLRVLAPDAVGLGFSSAAPSMAWHSLAAHAEVFEHWTRALGLNRFVIAGQDWGGPWVGSVAARRPECIAGAVFANTAIAAVRKQPRVTFFHGLSNRPVISDILFRGLGFPLPVLSRVQGDRSSIGLRELAAYGWPLRSFAARSTVLGLARMVPTRMDHPTLAELEKIDAWARGFRGPVELVWGLRDPILGPALRRVRELFPQAPVTETQAGHFLQEEVPQQLAEAIVRVAQRT